MSLPPVEIPLGAMRFNSDSQKLEYWSGSASDSHGGLS